MNKWVSNISGGQPHIDLLHFSTETKLIFFVWLHHHRLNLLILLMEDIMNVDVYSAQRIFETCMIALLYVQVVLKTY